jgi:hypothetical protein
LAKHSLDRVEPWTILCVEEDVNPLCLGKCDDLAVMVYPGVIKKQHYSRTFEGPLGSETEKYFVEEVFED